MGGWVFVVVVVFPQSVRFQGSTHREPRFPLSQSSPSAKTVTQ